MTIYIVTSGAYSDYSIDAVFLDRALADEYCRLDKERDSYDPARVEEWDVSDSVPSLTSYITIEVDYQGTAKEYPRTVWEDDLPEHAPEYAVYRSWLNGFSVWGRDVERVRAIAAELVSMPRDAFKALWERK